MYGARSANESCTLAGIKACESFKETWQLYGANTPQIANDENGASDD
jgi:hypothetical protein